MPLYEYQCQVCKARFERRQRMSDRPLRVCPECGGELQRLYRMVGVVFKGKGFYATDYRGKFSTARSGSDSSGEKKESAGGDSKSD